MPRRKLNPRTLPLAAVALAAVGLGCTSFAGDAEVDPKAPVACAIEVEEAGAMLTLKAVATAREAVEGRYALDIDRRGGGGSATIRQGGSFALKAGETATLGRATMNGPRAALDAELTLTVDGEELTCAGLGPIEI